MHELDSTGKKKNAEGEGSFHTDSVRKNETENRRSRPLMNTVLPHHN